MAAVTTTKSQVAQITTRETVACCFWSIVKHVKRKKTKNIKLKQWLITADYFLEHTVCWKRCDKNELYKETLILLAMLVVGGIQGIYDFENTNEDYEWRIKL